MSKPFPLCLVSFLIVLILPTCVRIAPQTTGLAETITPFIPAAGETPESSDPPAGAATEAPAAVPTETPEQPKMFFPLIGVDAARPGPETTPTLIPVDPHVEIQLEAAELLVGETMTLTVQAVDIGLPYFVIHARDSSAPDGAALGQVTYENVYTPQGVRVEGLELVSAEAEMNAAQFVLRGLVPGPVEVWVTATGEIHYGYPGPATWGGGSSEVVLLTVEP